MALFRRNRKDSEETPRGLTAPLATVVKALPNGQASERDVATYVATGEKVQVLQQIRQTPGSSQFGYGNHVTDAQWRELYAFVGSTDPAVWVRWGQVLEAQRGNNQWSVPLGAAGLVPFWFEHLLSTMAEGWSGSSYPPPPPHAVPVAFADLAAVAVAGGLPVEQLIDGIFTATRDMRWTTARLHRFVAGTRGFADVVNAHLDRIHGRLTTGGVEQRQLFLELLTLFDDDQLAHVAPHLAVAATSTSTRIRDAARPLLLRVLGAATPALRELAVEGKPDVRAAALELLHRQGADADRQFARETAAADRTDRIRALVDTWDGTAADTPTAEMPAELAVPTPAPIEWRVEVDATLRTQLDELARWHDEHVQRVNQQRARFRDEYTKRWGKPYPHMSKENDLRLDPGLARRLVEEMGRSSAPRLRTGPMHHEFGQTVTFFAGQTKASPVALVKVINELGLLARETDLSPFTTAAMEQCHARTGEPDLLTLQQMLDEMGLDGSAAVLRQVTRGYGALASGWPDEDVWPWVASNLELVIAHARPKDGDYWTDPRAFYRLVATLPATPPVVVEHLYSVALGLGKTHRPDAQQALQAHPERTQRAAAALADGKSEVRTVAATWLAQLADPAALPALEAAFKKERQDVAKGAILDALEALGQPVESYLDRDKLAAEADKALAKGLPKDLDWLAWDRLPPVRWADTGEELPLAVVQHLVAQAVRAKSAEPNAIVRKYLGMVDETGRQALAHALLQSWIVADTRPISEADAVQRAQQQAQSMHRWMQQQPGSFQNDPLFGKSVAELTAAYLPAIARTPAGSEAASKGLLAVVAAAGGRDVVPPTERYLREWYGQRAAQGKALISMLAWVQHPSATQLLLAISSRFRTKSFQVEAGRQVEALAEREGWTVAELADRTVPTAGFDAEGRLELSYGARAFEARLLPDLGVELRNEDGAVIKSLPSPRQSDDEEEVKAAKASFTAAKKELKSLTGLQQQRLYEAMCTDRTWSGEDWQRFLAGHPVMRLLVQRLVWVAQTPEPDARRLVFRLLDDGTLSDVEDEEVTLPTGAEVRLAHDTTLSADEVQAWLAHLADYEVQPLFQQLGKGLHTVPDDKRSTQAIDDFTGHTLEAFALRNRALKLGWTRGPAEDGGWFHVYLKRFPTLGLLAQLHFTGNGLPEENRTVGLLELSFAREDPREGVHMSQPVALGDVPAVLLSETWHDVRTIAAEGGGFDPNWQKATEY